MANINLPNGIIVNGQLPLDGKSYFKTLAEMIDLGASNFKAFYYYDSMIVICVEDKKQYIWRKKRTVIEQGLLPQDFVYPAGAISNGIDYSNQSYNFYVYDPVQLANQITSGGQISWEGGLTYYIAPLTYIINNTAYSASADTVTFAIGDNTFDRFDAIVVDTSGNILIIPGQPAEIPAQPIINNSIYCLITYVRINTGQTVANIVATLVYDENAGTPTEFDTSASELSAFTFDSPDFPNTNSICLYYKGIGQNEPERTFQFRRNDLFNFVDYDTLEFYIRLEDPLFTNPKYISVVLENSESQTESDRLTIDANYNLSLTISESYQRIIVPINDFQNSPIAFDIIKFYLENGEHIPFRLDTVNLYSGIPNNNNQLQGFLELIDVFEDSYAGKAGYKAVVNGTETGMVLSAGTTLQTFTADADQTDFTIAGSPASLTLVLSGRTAPIPTNDYTYANGTLSFTEGLLVGTLVRVFADLDAIPINAPNENAAEILKTKVSLTPSQIINIGTTPIEAIPTPGANKFVNILNANAVLIWNTTAYSNSSLTLSNTNANPWYFTFNVLLAQTEDTVAIGTRNGTPLAAINAPVLIGGTDSVEIGDSPIDVYITYEIITL